MSNISFEQWKKHIVQSAKRTKTPIFGQFELTPRCNLDCKMCYIHNESSNSLREKELSTETWKRIFDEAYEMGLMFATLTGGECLLRADFKELYLYLWNKRVYMSVCSNGLLFGEEYIEFFKKYPPRMVQISLYGSCEDSYLNVTGHRGYERVIGNIHSLMDAGINVRVAVTPSSYLKNDYINTLLRCRENGFTYTNNEFLLMPNRDDSAKEDHYLTMEEIVKLSKERTSLDKELSPIDCTPEPCGCGTEPPVGLTCKAGSCTAVVNWEGKMYPCTALPIDHASLLEMSYAEAWERIKRYVSEAVLGIECVGCPYDNVCPKCPAIRLKDLRSGHCNPAVCELTRKLVAAGVKKLDQKPESCEE